MLVLSLYRLLRFLRLKVKCSLSIRRQQLSSRFSDHRLTEFRRSGVSDLINCHNHPHYHPHHHPDQFRHVFFLFLYLFCRSTFLQLSLSYFYLSFTAAALEIRQNLPTFLGLKTEVTVFRVNTTRSILQICISPPLITDYCSLCTNLFHFCKFRKQIFSKMFYKTRKVFNKKFSLTFESLKPSHSQPANLSCLNVFLLHLEHSFLATLILVSLSKFCVSLFENILS